MLYLNKSTWQLVVKKTSETIQKIKKWNTANVLPTERGQDVFWDLHEDSWTFKAQSKRPHTHTHISNHQLSHWRRLHWLISSVIVHCKPSPTAAITCFSNNIWASNTSQYSATGARARAVLHDPSLSVNSVNRQ